MPGTAFVAPTTIKTSAYTALPGDLVPVDATALPVTVHLPSPAPDEALVAVKMVKTAGANTVTVACGGSDTFNDSGTGTLSISAVNQALVMQYAAPVGVWYVLSGDVAGSGSGSYLPLAGGTMTGWLAPAVSALTDGGTISVNAALGNVFTVTIAGNRTMANPSNPVDGQHIIFEVTQDSTGSRALTWGTAYLFGAGGAPGLSTAPGATDMLGFIYSAAASGWLYAGSSAGAYRPWQFPVAAYGAKGDGQVAADVVTTSSSAVITSATIYADTGCVGKTIMINGGNGSSAIPLITTIIQRGPTANQLTLNTTAGATVSSAGQAFWATDDTSAVNTAITAAGTYAANNDYYAEVVFDARFYGLASGPAQSTSPQFNAQLPLPYPNVNGATQKMVIKLTGAADQSHFQYWEGTVPNLAGTCLVSLVVAPHTVSGTYGNQSVVGGPSAGGAFTGAFANTKAIIDGIMVVCPPMADQYAFDFRYLSAADVYKSSAHVFTSVLGNAPALPSLPANSTFQNSHAVALAMPIVGNNADCDIDSFTAEGYPLGYKASDTFNARRLGAFYCATGMLANLGDGALSNKAGQITVADFICGQGNVAISLPTGTAGVVPVYINLTTEGIGTAHLSDPNNQVFGVIHWNDTAVTTPLVSGGANVKFINDRIPLGYWNPTQPSGYPTPPAVPASGSAVTIYRDATIWLSSTGTITALAIDGTSLPVTAGAQSALMVPAGHSWSPTYSGSLSATWITF